MKSLLFVDPSTYLGTPRAQRLILVRGSLYRPLDPFGMILRSFESPHHITPVVLVFINLRSSLTQSH